MEVVVKCFASLAETVGFEERRVALAEGATALGAWRAAVGSDGPPPGILTAVNLVYAPADTVLSDGDEVAFFPPVTGGEPFAIEVSEPAFDPWQVIAGRERDRRARGHRIGAVNVFVGNMRDVNEGDAVSSMQLEHYPGMTDRHLAEIAAAAASRWPLFDVLIRHRVGRILPGETIVLVAVWAGHRAEAFEACRFVMEDLKSKAPFWKKETIGATARWVTSNTPGYTDDPEHQGGA
mgnify:FL=1